jgi:hypothetical protein
VNTKLIYLSLFLGAIFSIGGGSKAQAQIIGELKASIPFDFHAGGATLPAGKYTIHVLESPQENMLEIRSDDNHSSALIETRDAQSHILPKTSELLFNHTGNDYYLSRIFDQEDRDGAAVLDSGYSKKYGTSTAIDQRHIAATYKSN